MEALDELEQVNGSGKLSSIPLLYNMAVLYRRMGVFATEMEVYHNLVPLIQEVGSFSSSSERL